MSLLKFDYKCHMRNDKFLLIFPEIPYWIIVDSSGKSIIDLFYKYDTFREVYDYICMKSTTGKQLKQLKLIYTHFKNNGIFDFIIPKKSMDEWHHNIYSAGINITKNCNLKCPYCYADANSLENNENNIDSLTKEDISKFLDGVKKYATKNCSIQLTGGEPLLRKDLLYHAIEYSRRLGIAYVTVNTNGILLDDKDIDFFKRFNVDNVTISLDGVHENAHDLVRGKGTFRAAKRAIHQLKDNGIYVTASITVHKDNMDEVVPFLKYCEEMGVEGFNSPTFPVGRGKNIDNGIEPCDISELCSNIREAYEAGILSENAIRYSFLYIIVNSVKNITRRYYCNSAIASLFLNSDGKIYPCANTIGLSTFYGGDIKCESFDNIWINSEKFNFIRNNINIAEGKDCCNCELRYICAGFCRAITYLNTNSLYGRSIWCKEIHKSIIDAMWFVADHPTIFKGMIDKFSIEK